MRLDDLRTVVRPGDGLVGRFADAVLVVLLGGTEDPAAVDRLLDECGKGPVADRLDDLRAAAGGGVPSFAVVVDTGDGLAVFVAGDAQATITGAEPVLRLSGRDPSGWTGRVRDRFGSLAVGVDLGDAGAPTGSRLDLRAGVVPGSGVVLTPHRGTTGAGPEPMSTAVAPAPALAAERPVDPPPPVTRASRPQEPSAVPPRVTQPPVTGPGASAASLAASVESASRSAPVAAPAGVPSAEPAGSPTPWPTVAEVAEVWGIRCKKGHFNDPAARYCGVCGIHMVQDSAARVKGPRPVLGFMVLDDGTTYKLDADYVIGSDPHGDESVSAGRARPLVIADDGGVISPVHARITLRGWDVQVADCGSVYGTYVWVPGSTAWERLRGEEPVTLAAGSQVMVAQRGFMFQPVNKR